MTYATDLDSDVHRRGFYVAFDGIETRIATHDFTGDVAGTFLRGLQADSISGGERSLDFEHGLVLDAGVSFSVIDDDDTRALFTRRGGTDTFLATALTSSAIDVFLGSASDTYADGSTIYIGSETIILGAHAGAGEYNTCTRGAFGSTATTHAANEVISDKPRKWYSRRCTVYDVNLDTFTTQALWYGSLSTSPAVTNGVRQFSATSRMDEWLTRPICSGFRDYSVNVSTMTITEDTGRVSFVFGDAVEQYEFAVATNGAWMRVDVDGAIGFFFVESSDLTSASLTIDMGVQWAETQDQGAFSTSTALTLLNFQNASKITVRQVELVNGPLSVALLAVIRSRLGTDAFDILPGRDSNAAGTALSYFYRKRMGAGIPSGEVDVASFQEIVGGSTTDLEPLLDEERLGAFLERAIWRTGGYIFTTSSGKLGWKKFDGVGVRGAVTSYTATTQFLNGDVTASDDEQGTPGGASVSGNFSPLDEEYRRTIDLIWFDDADLYADRDQRYKYESRSLKLGEGGTSWGEIEQAMDRRRARRAYAGRRTSYRMPWRYWQAMLPGTRISLTDTRLDDGEGGVGVSGRFYEVIRFTPDWAAGFITVELDEVYRSSVFAPSGKLASNPAAGANPTLTLTADFTDDDGSPANDFPIGCTIRVLDSSDDFLTSTTLVVASRPSGTQLATTGTPSFTLRGSDLVEIAISDDVGAVNDIGADLEDFAFAADTGLLIDSGADERAGPRWG